MNNLASLNEHYWLLLRDAAQRDLSQACFHFGVSKEIAQRAMEMSMQDIERLSSAEQVMFGPSLSLKQINTLTSSQVDNHRRIYLRLCVQPHSSLPSTRGKKHG